MIIIIVRIMETFTCAQIKNFCRGNKVYDYCLSLLKTYCDRLTVFF